MEKNSRASNFSAREVDTLINLVKVYKNEVECKKTDTDTNKIKADAWEQNYNEFNSILGDPHRTIKVLKNKYENIKKRTKQKFADNKIYVSRTGGGPYKDVVLTDTASDLHEIFGSQLTGLTSKYDNDATAESIIIEFANNSAEEDIGDDPEEIPLKKRKRDMLQSPSGSNYVGQNDTPTISQKMPLTTRDSNLENCRILSSNCCAESSSTDWEAYTPAMLKKPLSVPLQQPENKKSTSYKLSAKLEDWVKNNTKYGEKAFNEKHELTIRQMKEKHQLEMAIQKEESQARLKFLEEEHILKMKILEKQYSQK